MTYYRRYGMLIFGNALPIGGSACFWCRPAADHAGTARLSRPSTFRVICSGSW